MIVMNHLDKSDIQSIIARHFNVPIDEVTVDCYMETIGYGLHEHEEPSVRAVVALHEQSMPRTVREESIANGWVYGQKGNNLWQWQTTARLRGKMVS